MKTDFDFLIPDARMPVLNRGNISLSDLARERKAREQERLITVGDTNSSPPPLFPNLNTTNTTASASTTTTDAAGGRSLATDTPPARVFEEISLPPFPPPSNATTSATATATTATTFRDLQPEGSFLLFIESPNHSKKLLRVANWCTILSIQMKMEELLKIPISDQKLTDKNGTLLDANNGSKTLADYNINTDATLQLTVIELIPTPPPAPPSEVNLSTDNIQEQEQQEQEQEQQPQLDREDFDCALCRCIFHEPLATNCGHTFCRACLARALTIAQSCPMCRAPCFVDCTKAVPNFIIAQYARAAAPQEAAERAATAAADAEALRHARLSLFFLNSADSFTPGSPVELGIFEPRYRLLVARCLEAAAPFGLMRHVLARFGAVIRITSTMELPDGRLALTGKVEGRFRVLATPVEEMGMAGLHSAVVDYYSDTPLIHDESPDIHLAPLVEVVAVAQVRNNGNILAHALGQQPHPPIPLPPPTHASTALVVIRFAIRGLNARDAQKRIGDVCIDVAGRQLVNLGAAQLSSMRTLLRRVGTPPLRHSENYLSLWSFWLTSACSLTRIQRAEAMDTTSSLTRMCIVYCALYVAARRAERIEAVGGVGGVGPPPPGSDPTEYLTHYLSSLNPEHTFSNGNDTDDDEDENADETTMRLIYCMCGRNGLGYQMALQFVSFFNFRRFYRYLVNPACYQFLIMIGLLIGLYIIKLKG